MWSLDTDLNRWFERISQERKEKYGGGSTNDEDHSTPMMQNELARDRR